MNIIWRFYMDADRQWRWQQLTVSKEVIAESARAYKAYEKCVANATERGYTFEPSQTRQRTARSR